MVHGWSTRFLLALILGRERVSRGAGASRPGRRRFARPRPARESWTPAEAAGGASASRGFRAFRLEPGHATAGARGPGRYASEVSCRLRDDQGERDVVRQRSVAVRVHLERVGRTVGGGAAHLDYQLIGLRGRVAVLDADHRRPRRVAAAEGLAHQRGVEREAVEAPGRARNGTEAARPLRDERRCRVAHLGVGERCAGGTLEALRSLWTLRPLWTGRTPRALSAPEARAGGGRQAIRPERVRLDLRVR